MKKKWDISLQIKYNSRLIGKLHNYLMTHAEVSEKLPNDSSYVVFSARNSQLNKQNEKIVDKLLKEGKKNIIKAEETKSRNTPWKLTILAS